MRSPYGQWPPLLQELQLVEVQEEQLLWDTAGCTEPSELPKLHADMSRFTFALEQSGQLISWFWRMTSFSNFRPQSLQAYSYMGMGLFSWFLPVPAFAFSKKYSYDVP